MKKKIDKVWVGIVAGVLGGILGFLMFGYGFSLKEDLTFKEFYYDVFLGREYLRSKVVTFSMLIDVVLFFVFIRKDYQNFCKGLMAVLILSVAVVAWLY